MDDLTEPRETRDPDRRTGIRGDLSAVRPKPARRQEWRPHKLAVAILLLIGCTGFAARAHAQEKHEVKRIVIIKADGLPERLVERYAAEPAAGDQRAGHTRLPWIEHVFGENGAWLTNFYVRGLSLSAPSWSLLDTGRHLEVRGNAEYDRYTLRVFDYLNFFPFYVGYSMAHRADMPGVELLDEQGVPLLIDRFPYEDRYQSFQLYQRGARIHRLESALTVKFKDHKVKDIFDEWTTGFSMTDSIGQEMERELLEKIKDPRIRYLDLYTGDYDHVAHLTNDRVAQFHVIEALDTLIGRVWTAIQASPLASSTALVLVSDHGMNTSDGIYSQGYNLIDWFNSAAGGGHHVLTNRHPMTEFKLKGLDPFVSEVISPSAESAYLAGESAHYPTCVMDLDGNERATISLRNNSLNVIQILLDQLIRKRVTGRVRRATIDALFQTLDGVRPQWQRELDGLDAGIRELEGRIEKQQKRVDSQAKKFTKEQRDAGEDEDASRQVARLESWKTELRGYSAYSEVMHRLLALDPADFDPGKFKIEDLVPRKSLGEPNSIQDLQHYVTGVRPGGLVVSAQGTLDMEKSFRRIDYFTALKEISVRNNVQKDVAPRPIDFIAVALKNTVASSNAVWLWRGADRQAVIETRRTEAGRLELRYVPVKTNPRTTQLGAGSNCPDGTPPALCANGSNSRTTQDTGIDRPHEARFALYDRDNTKNPVGEPQYERAEWAAGFPLELFEDPKLEIPTGEGTASDRETWLSDWHDEREWLRATHATKYSNGIVGVVEEMLLEPTAASSASPLLELERQLRLPDMIAFANDHWNFDVRGFNPGGNHGSFLRVSTHSVLMFAGGADTGIPHGARITEPYDSLSLVPTILTLMNLTEPDLPGPVIRELAGPVH